MMGLFNTLADLRATRSARASLDGLVSAVGVTGLPAARGRPGLLAVVDQHAAAVRDSLAAGPRALSELVLAGYAEGVRETAFRHGWRAPRSAIDWSKGDWVLHRLLAVCLLVEAFRAHGTAPSPATVPGPSAG
jgi:hypothetical protein